MVESLELCEPESLRLEDLHLPAPLREYQWKGVSFLFRSGGGLLADEMGLGKTVQAAVALAIALRAADVNRALVVAPASLTLNWTRELGKWAPGLAVRRVVGGDAEREATYQLPIEVLVASYEQIRIDAVDRIASGTFDIVVLDEAQRIKNRGSRTAFACRLLPRRYSWALTATPLENSRADLEAVFAFVKPGLVNKHMKKEEMFALVEPHLLRRRKGEVLPDLPPVIIQDLFVDLAEEQRDAYEKVWDSRVETLDSEPRPISTSALFALLTKLKQICNFDPVSGRSSKLDALMTVIESLSQPTDKIIIFSQYVVTLKWLADRLNGIEYELYHGGISEQARDEIISKFEGSPGPRILLMSLRAGGTGLNLPSASVVVLFDRWWNPAVEVQAIYRAHRFERSRPLQVIRFLVQDTIEDRISEILDAKQALFDEYVEGAPNADVPLLTRGELLRVLELRRGETE